MRSMTWLASWLTLVLAIAACGGDGRPSASEAGAPDGKGQVALRLGYFLTITDTTAGA